MQRLLPLYPYPAQLWKYWSTSHEALQEQPQQVPDMSESMQPEEKWSGIEPVTLVMSPMVEEVSTPQPTETIPTLPVPNPAPILVKNRDGAHKSRPKQRSRSPLGSPKGANELMVLDSWDTAEESSCCMGPNNTDDPDPDQET